MSAGQYAPRGPLWADRKQDRDSVITLPRAFVIAALIEGLIFLAAFYMPVADDYGTPEQPPMSVELVKLPEPPKKEEPPPEPPKVEPKPLPEPPPKPIPKPEPPKPVVKPEPPKVEIKPEPKIEPKIIIPESKPEPIPAPKVEPPPKPEPIPEPVVQAPPPEPVKEPPRVEAKASEKVEAPKQVRNAKPIHKVAAAYPKSAQREGKMGKVKARLTVGEDGHVLDVEILESDPPGVFDDAVTKAVKQYRFEADGTRYLVDQTVKFSLEN